MPKKEAFMRVDSDASNEIDGSYTTFQTNSREKSSRDLSEKIFSGTNSTASLANKKVNHILYKKPNVSGEARAVLEWGGSEGTKASLSATVTVDDGKNHVAAGIRQDSDGNGSVSLSAGSETKDKDPTQNDRAASGSEKNHR
jgi:hypothetical protein